MRVIRASEIGTYQFCHRAWWYRQQGIQPENHAALEWGSHMHQQHSQKVLAGSCLQMLAYASLLGAVLAAVIWVIQAGL
jgi:hypothetical protein